MNVTYKEYRAQTPLGTLMDHSYMGYIASALSPFTSIACMKFNLRPNTITLLMIITGVIGGVVMMIPSPWANILSTFIYILWFTFDCSDGEVARFTKTFSKGGKYLDWCAHLLTHSLFIVGMWATMYYWMPEYNMLTTVFSFLFLSAELIGRNRIAMDTLYGNIENTPYNSELNFSLPYWLYWNIVYFPNILLFVPVLIGLSILFGWLWFYWVYLAWALLYTVVMLRIFFMFICRMYKS